MHLPACADGDICCIRSMQQPGLCMHQSWTRQGGSCLQTGTRSFAAATARAWRSSCSARARGPCSRPWTWAVPQVHSHTAHLPSMHAAVLLPRDPSLDEQPSTCLFACMAGLSTLELQRAFPGARIVALDLSPHFLAVARHLQRQRQAAAGGAEEPIR